MNVVLDPSRGRVTARVAGCPTRPRPIHQPLGRFADRRGRPTWRAATFQLGHHRRAVRDAERAPAHCSTASTTSRRALASGRCASAHRPAPRRCAQVSAHISVVIYPMTTPRRRSRLVG